MKFLFLHANFPSQFVYLASFLRKQEGCQVAFITASEERHMDNVRKVIFTPKREPSPDTQFYLTPFERAVIQGQAVFEKAAELRQEGFIPDMIIGHSGWGSTMYMKDVFPESPLLCYFEWFYHARGSDVDFGDAELSPDEEARVKMKNAPILLDLYACDQGMSPTYWQQKQFPVEYANKIKVIFDGVDTAFCSPRPGAKMVLPEAGLDLSQAEEIVTYVGRGMEPYRGFPQFMEAMEIVLKRRPKCHVVIVGSDRVCYGRQLPEGQSYKDIMLKELQLDPSRVHFMGYLQKPQYIQVLQASDVHVYLTRPFVLSWSMLEAMSCGCCLVASNTPPVTEVINHGVNGLLADFFSPQEIADRVEEGLQDKRRCQGLRARARETILDRYSVDRCLSQQIALINGMIQGRGR